MSGSGRVIAWVACGGWVWLVGLGIVSLRWMAVCYVFVDQASAAVAAAGIVMTVYHSKRFVDVSS